MTIAPNDLVVTRLDLLHRTGLPGDAIGIKGNAAHVADGIGYHLGKDQLKMGRGPYSARLARDRRGLTNAASALDLGCTWGHGGRAAWLRFNRLLLAALRAGDPALAGIRAINCTLDGQSRHRFDRENGFKDATSSDSVTTHTHIEWYRDTEGARAGACRARLLQLVDQAITGKAADDMTPQEQKQLTDARWQTLNAVRADGTRGAVTAATGELWAHVKALETGLAAVQAAYAAGTPLTAEQLERVIQDARQAAKEQADAELAAALEAAGQHIAGG